MTVGAEFLAGLVAAAEAIRARAAERHAGLEGADLAGIGWATVELERAVREVGAALGLDPGAWVPAARDDVLGARAWSALLPVEAGPTIVLLEPDTEGRLAATLVRFAEGVAAVYLRGQGAGGSASGPGLAATDIGASTVAQGALGPARLVPGAPAWGPHALLLEPPGPGRDAMPVER